MVQLFSFITHAKSSIIVLSGELANSSPLAFAEGLFILEKEILKNLLLIITKFKKIN